MQLILYLMILFGLYTAIPITEEYRFDYSLFKNKTLTRKTRSTRARFLDRVLIESVEAKLDWNQLSSQDRMGMSFVLKKGDKYVENAVLYHPRDESFVVRSLLDAVGYNGELRILKDKQAFDDLNKTNEQDTTFFKFNTARIVSGNTGRSLMKASVLEIFSKEGESKSILKTLQALQDSGIKLQSVSVNLKFPKQKENTILEVSDLSHNNTKMVVHVVPNTVSVVVNDLPSHTVVRMSLKPFGTEIKEIASTYLFTGSITLVNKSPEGSASRIALYRPTGTKRLTVTCFVENKTPFQGFPCKGSSVCVPLHWECDGDDDCQDGFDEQGCQGGLTTYSLSNNFNNNHNSDQCRRHEFQCFSRGVQVCLPVSWLCDGRTDCSDGWDEHQENCDHIQYPSYNQNYHHNYPSSCTRDYFKCTKGGCVAPRHICDGHKDCSDGSDESDCPDDEDRYDIDEDYDKDNHCDLNHEFECGRISRRTKCVPRPWVCDDQDDCPNGEDEDDDICRNHYHNFND